MRSVLVCHSYFLGFDEKQLQRAKPYPPLATLQVAALLRDRGYAVDLFDAMLAEDVTDFAATLEDADPAIVLFYEDNFNFLSKMCLGRMRRACREMVSQACCRGARVIVAGSDATDAPNEYLSAGADAVLQGEGLEALVALVSRLSGDGSIPVSRLVAGLPDVVADINGEIFVSTPAAPLPATSFPKQPAWDLVDLDAYRHVWRQAHGYFSLNMAASRGCSFRCNWCAKPIWGDRYIQRSAADVAAEMLYLRREFDVDHVWFADDIFGFRADWIEGFTNALRESGGGLPFTIQLRADLVSVRMAEALANAGCQEVWIGAESGSQTVLDAMNKGTSLSQIRRARELLGQRGIRVGFFIMLGYLGEEIDDILATRDLLIRARPDDVGVSVAYPLPGTKFYASVRKQLRTKRNWQESKDLEMMFAGTYQTDFYREIRNLLHDQIAEGWSDLLSSRWDDLVAREAQYRQASDPAEHLPFAMSTAR